MGAVIPIIRKSDVELAWDAYAAHKTKELIDPSLVIDRAHVEEGARLHARFCQLYMAGAGRDNVQPLPVRS